MGVQMKTLVACALLLSVGVAVALIGRPSPNYAKCLEVENETSHGIVADVLYENGLTSSAHVKAGGVAVFSEQVSDEGSYRRVSPVVSLTVSYTRRYAGPLKVTHQVEVQGVHNCVRRVVQAIPGGVTIQ